MSNRLFLLELRIAFAAITTLADPGALADTRLIERALGAEISARGFTGSAGCIDVACLEYNPAFLVSESDDVELSVAAGVRFNEALFDTIDSWEDTKAIYASDQYREILVNSWNFVSRQTAKTDVSFGLRLQGLALAYSPVRLGALLFAHDPVLPYGEIYNYFSSSLSAGYGVPIGRFNAGIALKYASGSVSRFTFDQLGGSYEESQKLTSRWLTARLGVSTVLFPRQNTIAALTVSGIPLFGKAPSIMPGVEQFDMEPAIASDLARTWWGKLRGYYSMGRLFRDENLLLNQHAGLELTVGRTAFSLGLSDALPTYGVSIELPLFRFTASSYAVEYSGLIHNLTDRVYWFQVDL